MLEDMIDIQDLMLKLGYSDPRSVKKWCAERNIPIIPFGLKKYVSSHYLTQYIDNQYITFVKPEMNDKKTPNTTSPKISNSTSKYNSENEIINKYLSKYESNDKSQTTKKR